MSASAATTALRKGVPVAASERHNARAAPAPSADKRYCGYAGELALRIYRPAAEMPSAVVVLFHGGGFVGGSLDAIATVAAGMAARLDLAVATPGYTLAGERAFPAAVEDAYAAIAWAAENAQREQWDPGRLIVAGVEAGGNLAAVAAMMARDRGGPALAAQILVAPMLDPTLTSHSMQHASASAPRWQGECNACYRAYLPNAADRLHPYAAPSSCSRVAGLAPALILTARDDPLRDEAEAYGAKLVAAGVTTEVARLQHIEAAKSTWTEEAWTALKAFVRRLFISHAASL
jgi:acetyl esterase